MLFDSAKPIKRFIEQKNTTFHKKGACKSGSLGGGGSALRAHLRGGGSQMRAICVHRGGGGQKRAKNCVRTYSMPPKVKATIFPSYMMVIKSC